MKNNVKVLLCTLILLSLALSFSVLCFASGEIDDREPSDVQGQIVSYKEIIPEITEGEEEESFVVYIPTIPTATTTESAYEIAEREAESKISVIEEEYNAAESERQAAIKGYDLSIRAECLCSVTGNISLQMLNKTTGVVYLITLSPKNGYYHYKEYPEGDYELTDLSPSEHAYTVETQSFSLGKYEHISLSVLVYDDEEEYKNAKESKIAKASEYYAHVITTDDSAISTTDTSVNIIKDNNDEKLPTSVFILCVFIAFFCVAGLIIAYAKRKARNDDETPPDDSNSKAM